MHKRSTKRREGKQQQIQRRVAVVVVVLVVGFRMFGQILQRIRGSWFLA